MKRKPQIGDQRYREMYLLFPMTIAGQRRWLRRAKWFELYTYDIVGGKFWMPVGWKDW
jgi:hypothetical protein